jgi:hypothetical protein
MIASELEGAVVSNLREKEKKYERMAEAMISHMRGFNEAAIRAGRQTVSVYEPKIEMELPSWMAHSGQLCHLEKRASNL